MNTKSLLAVLAGTITLFVVGYLLYGLAFAGFFESHSNPGLMRAMDDVNMFAILLGNLAGALILTIIFGSWSNISSFADGLKAGAIFGLLVCLSYDLIMYGTTTASDLTATLVDPIINAVLFGVTGGVVGMMLGRGGSDDS